MASSDELAAYKEQMEKIYGDTSYFIDAITSEYGFYGKFISAVSDGKSLLGIQRKVIKKNVRTEWVEAIELALPALDMAIRHPSVTIEEREEVLPIEFSRNITQKSLMHLSQHTDYISRVNEDGTVMPSKILNVFHDESNKTYENKFLNTLIDRLFGFIDRRFSAIKEYGTCEQNAEMNFESNFRFSSSYGKVKMTIESTSPAPTQDEDDVFDRVKKIHGIVIRYMGSEFVKSMDGAMVKPPIMRTNAITKNKYLSQCLALWDFLESYDKIGYEVEYTESSEMPDQQYLDMLYSLLSLQYMSFSYGISEDYKHISGVFNTNRTAQPFIPEYIQSFQPVDTEKFSVHDTEYRKIYNSHDISDRRRLTGDELRVRDALELALKYDKKLFGKKTGRKRAKKTSETQ